MIQRKQTLYLLVVTAISITVTLLNITLYSGKYKMGEENFNYKMGIMKTEFYSDLQSDVKVPPVSNNALMYFALLSGIVPFVAIFLYKKLEIQIRFAALNFVLIAGFFIYIYITNHQLEKSLLGLSNNNFSWNMSILSLIPIFNWLAIRGIKKDIELLASVDRLR